MILNFSSERAEQAMYGEFFKIFHLEWYSGISFIFNPFLVSPVDMVLLVRFGQIWSKGIHAVEEKMLFQLFDYFQKLRELEWSNIRILNFCFKNEYHFWISWKISKWNGCDDLRF